MKFSIEKSKFTHYLDRAVQATGGGPPVLQGVLLEVNAKGLHVTGYDLEVAYRATVALEGEHRAGKALVDAHKLAAVIRSLPTGDVNVEGTAKRLVVSSGSIEFKLAVLDVDTYPTPQELDATTTPIDAAALVRSLAAVQYAVSRDTTRYTLCGVFLSTVDGKATLVGTDGHRLAKTEVPWTGAEVHGVILPSKAVGIVRNILERPEGPVAMGIKDRAVVFNVDGQVLTLRLIDGSFPDWKAIVPTDKPACTWTVSRKALGEALRRLAIFGLQLKIDVKAGVMITADPDLGDAKEQIPGVIDGEFSFVGVNAGYLREVLAASPTDEVVVELRSDLDPVLIRSGEALALVMPMRL